MGKKRLFVSFDFDHDSGLKELFVGQSRHSDTPFELADWSIKEAIANNWKDHARSRLKQVNSVAVICGRFTHTAKGIDAEIQIAREVGTPYFLLRGYKDFICTRPTVASSEKMYDWTWDNVAALIQGAR